MAQAQSSLTTPKESIPAGLFHPLVALAPLSAHNVLNEPVVMIPAQLAGKGQYNPVASYTLIPAFKLPLEMIRHVRLVTPAVLTEATREVITKDIPLVDRIPCTHCFFLLFHNFSILSVNFDPRNNANHFGDGTGSQTCDSLKFRSPSEWDRPRITAGAYNLINVFLRDFPTLQPLQYSSILHPLSPSA